VLNILVFIAFANLSLNNNEVAPLFRAILLVVIIVTIFFAISLNINQLALMNKRLTADENVNENRFGMMAAQLAAYSLAYIYLTKKIYVKFVCLAVSLINIMFIILSGSRSALIGIAFGFVSAILIFLYYHKEHIVKNIFFLVIICIGSALMLNFIIDAFPIINYRMDPDIIIESGGSRRWPRIIAELQYIIPDNFLWGVGPGALSEYLALEKYNIYDPGSSHNIIISLLAQMGFVGFMAYMVFFYRIISDAVSKIRLQRILFIPLMMILTAVFNGVGEVIYAERFFWNAFALTALCIMTSEFRHKNQPLSVKSASLRS